MQEKNSQEQGGSEFSSGCHEEMDSINRITMSKFAFYGLGKSKPRRQNYG
jgi:hypothetical protein